MEALILAITAQPLHTPHRTKVTPAPAPKRLTELDNQFLGKDVMILLNSFKLGHFNFYTELSEDMSTTVCAPFFGTTVGAGVSTIATPVVTVLACLASSLCAMKVCHKSPYSGSYLVPSSGPSRQGPC